MQGQLQFAQKQIEENKGMHEQLIAAINQKGTEKNTQDDQIIMINKSLSETIAQVEQRSQVLQNKVALLKGYKKVCKNAESI